MAAVPMSDDQRTTRLGSFLSGLSELITIAPEAEEPVFYPHRDEADALRSDGIRIGEDLRVVIDRESVRDKTNKR
jgi:hypothetical protein